MKITRCKLKKPIQIKLYELFVLEVTTRSAADLLAIYPNSAALFYRKIRLVISHHLALQAHELFDGEVEPDESYFGGVRKGKCGRGAAGKTAVFGRLKRNGKVYTVVVQDTKTKNLEIENFWNQAKRAQRKYNEIDRKSCPLFLKECKFRFNYGHHLNS